MKKTKNIDLRQYHKNIRVFKIEKIARTILGFAGAIWIYLSGSIENLILGLLVFMFGLSIFIYLYSTRMWDKIYTADGTEIQRKD